MKKVTKKILCTALACSVLLVGCSKKIISKKGNDNISSSVDETTTEVSTTEVPTTEVPTTEVPTTEVPTTEVPTTEVPTTEVPTTHVHSYISNITKEVTCEEQGIITYRCECGNCYNEEIRATGHSFGQYTYNNDATTKTDGTQTAICSKCGMKSTVSAPGTKLPEVVQGANQLTKEMNEDVEVFKYSSENMQKLKTLKTTVGGKVSISTAWQDYTILSQNTAVAVADGKIICGVSQGTTYVVVVSSLGLRTVYKVVVS